MKPTMLGIGMTSQRTRDRLVARLREAGIVNNEVLEVVRAMPRHIFVDEALASRAYEDTALPIGHGQTISQPYIVARMTEVLLEAGPLARVLEIGTGCGYQTAILARLVKEVYTVERIMALLQGARQRLRELHIQNVRFKHSDGSWGWPEHGEYDGILATAAPMEVPDALLQQLAVGGRLVIPVGPRGDQELLRITRTETGHDREVMEKVSFVPMLGGAG
ncbi:MAG: protein-L-isoaspartate O-methyltransferase [Gammaproteobacteria bacterium RBG_16_57_12]|nr:MAG: protein-L-isoaspartate O-methyltransferase [Gammaproteobacteria bacterium RBG_16_57_12]